MKKNTLLGRTWLLFFAFIICFGAQAQVYTGDLTLASQADVNAFNYTEVTGNLNIQGVDITNLSALSSLTSVGGWLIIQSNDDRLNCLTGLQNVNTVGDNLIIINNGALTSLTGLESLTSVGGGLVIRENLALTNLNGLENLTSVSEDIEIYKNEALTSLTGLENITNVPRHLDVILNTALTDLTALGKLTSVGGIFHIGGNDKLISLTGLENVTSVKHLYISGNSLLSNLSGLDGLTEVTQYLEIASNPSLKSLIGLQSLSSVASNMWVVNNDALITLAGLENLVYVGGNLSISTNAVLTNYCALYRLISQGGPTGGFDVKYNEVNPTRQEILDNCINKPPTATCQNVTVSADENCQAMVTAAEIDNGSYDLDEDEISLSVSPEGPYGLGVTNVTLTVDDGNGETATCEATITVTDDIPPVIICPAEIFENSAPDQCGAPVNFTVTASDNCEGPVTVLSIPSSGSYFPIGTTTVNSTSTDAAGNASSCSFNVTVTDNIAPTVETQDLTVQLDENGFASIVPADIDNGSTDACGIASITLLPNAFSCTNVGNNTVTLTVTDVNGNTGSKSAIVTVLNDLPVIDAVTTSPIDPIQLGTPAVITVNFTDDNATEVNIQWGDLLEDDYTTSTGVVNATHNYSLQGLYPVIVTVTDPCGEMTVYDYHFIVIYDPTEGFVTGGGWIFSLEGAYKPEPLLSGKANFGFVSKYKKGSTVPDGNTEFQFKAGNLNFKSTDYEWLVIAGSKAMFKGSGTVNGLGDYGFMLSAIDADLTSSAVIDKFRIKIWDKDNNDYVVYDNNLVVDDNADPTTEIGGGSIVIHTSKTKSTPIESGLISKTERPNISVYPNPFSENLHFEFQYPDDVHVLIEIYDLTGRKIETVFNSKIEGGPKYYADFTSKSEVPTMFLYRIKLGDNIQYGKVIYQK